MFFVKKFKGWLSHPFFYCSFVSIVLVFAYLDITSVPFYFDDKVTLFSKELTDILNSVFSPVSRTLTDIIFWGQREIFQNSVVGYHLVSFSLHLVLWLLATYLSYKLIRRHALEASKAQLLSIFLMLLGGWALLPVNSQPVVYIAQQYVIWCSLWSLLSLLCFRQWTESQSRWGYLLVSAVFWAFAVKSKQTALLLPLIHLTYWFLLAKPDRQQATRRTLLIAIIGLVVCIVFLLKIPVIDSITRETLDVSRIEYLKAQAVILWQYWGLVFWPEPLVLDYGIRSNIFSDTEVYLALTAHIVLITTAIFLARKQPWLTLAVISFYLLQTIESSFIPIQDFKLEHRIYLPSLFFWMFTAVGIVQTLKGKAYSLVLLPLASLLLYEAYIVNQRVSEWSNPERFYQLELENSHDRFWRAENELGVLYLNSHRYEKAARIFTKLLQDKSVPNNEALLINAIVAFSGLQKWNIVKRLEGMVIPHFDKLNAINKSRLLINRAIRLAAMGKCSAAKKFYHESKRYSEYTENYQVTLPRCNP